MRFIKYFIKYVIVGLSLLGILFVLYSSVFTNSLPTNGPNVLSTIYKPVTEPVASLSEGFSGTGDYRLTISVVIILSIVSVIIATLSTKNIFKNKGK